MGTSVSQDYKGGLQKECILIHGEGEVSSAIHPSVHTQIEYVPPLDEIMRVHHTKWRCGSIFSACGGPVILTTL